MREFDYQKAAEATLTPEIASALARLNNHAPMNTLLGRASKDRRNSIEEATLAQSAKSSLGMVGLSIPLKRMQSFVVGNAKPETDSELRAFDYLRGLATVRAQSRTTRVSPGVILLFHESCLKRDAKQTAGHWRTTGAFGNELPEIMRDMCDAYRTALRDGACDPLLASVLFVCDFLALKPFEVGNELIGHLLLELTLLKNGYEFCRYTSLERAMARSKNAYHTACGMSAIGWEANGNDYRHFVSYLLGLMEECAEAAGEVAAEAQPTATEDMVRSYFQNLDKPVTKQDILNAHPSISARTIERILSRLRIEGEIEMIGAARNARYRRARTYKTPPLF